MSRELDALVAEKVMGWQDARAFFPWPESGVMLDNYAMMPPHGGAIRDIAHVPHYSTDIAAAWEVWETLRSRDYYIAFTDTGYGVFEGDDWLLVTEADTAPLAICRAALEAVK